MLSRLLLDGLSALTNVMREYMMDLTFDTQVKFAQGDVPDALSNPTPSRTNLLDYLLEMDACRSH